MPAARRLTEPGMQLFADSLTALRDDPSADLPVDALYDERLSEPLDVVMDASFAQVPTRLDLARFLDRLIGHDYSTLRNDAGFWSWLAFCWFEELCPVRAGIRQPGDHSRWIAGVEDPRRCCQHLLLGPYQLFRAHRDDPERCLALLSGPPQRAGRLVGLFASRPSLATCPAVMGVVTRLYYNRTVGRLRRGISGRGPGSPVRLADVLNQLDLTWDLHSLTTDQLLDLLPLEFGTSRAVRNPRQRSLLEQLPPA